MCRKDKSFLEKKRRSSKEIKIEEEILFKRELNQSSIINQYTRKGLVFASLGIYHFRAGGKLIPNLDENNFIIASPLFNGKERLSPPSKFIKSEVSYVIKSVKK